MRWRKIFSWTGRSCTSPKRPSACPWAKPACFLPPRAARRSPSFFPFLSLRRAGRSPCATSSARSSASSPCAQGRSKSSPSPFCSSTSIPLRSAACFWACMLSLTSITMGRAVILSRRRRSAPCSAAGSFFCSSSAVCFRRCTGAIAAQSSCTAAASLSRTGGRSRAWVSSIRATVLCAGTGPSAFSIPSLRWSSSARRRRGRTWKVYGYIPPRAMGN